MAAISKISSGGLLYRLISAYMPKERSLLFGCGSGYSGGYCFFIRNSVRGDVNKRSLAEIVLSENSASEQSDLHFGVWQLRYGNESDEECFTIY